MNWTGALAAVAVATPFAIGVSVGAEPERPEVEFRFDDPAIVESSGLVARDGMFATVNDSGDTGRVFVVDPRSGETTRTLTVGWEPDDVEAMAPLPDGIGVLVADIGDNAGARESVSLYQVPWSARGSARPAFRLRYADGPRDAETLLVHPPTGQVFVASKGVLAGALYKAPTRLRADEVNLLRPVADVPGLLTDGAFFPDGRHLVLRDYGQMYVYSYPAMEVLGRVELPEQPQGEGIAVDERGRVFVSTEGQGTPVYRVPLPPRITRAMTDPEPAATPTTTATATPLPDPVAVDTDARGGGEPTDEEPGWWPWLLGPIIGIVVIVVLVRSLRPR